MSFLSPLTAPQLASVRGNYAGAQYLCLGSNTTVFACRVNQTSFGESFAEITYDGVTSGAYTDVEVGMTVLISHTNDRRKAFFVGRVREAPTSTVLKVNETSAAITDDDYIFVLKDYRLFHKLGRETGGVYYKDWNVTYASPGPLIYNLQSAYAGIVSGTPAGYTVAFAPLALAVTSGATISTWAWTIPTGGTITVGTAADQNITVRFDAAAAEYWVKLVVTDSGGRTTTRRFPVWAVPADLSTTVSLGFDGASIDADLDGGWSASLTAFEGIDTVLDNTICAILQVEYYGGVETSINGNLAFVGRLRTESNSTRADENASQVEETRYEVEGVGAQLARCTAPSIYIRTATAPSVWDQIASLTLWRAIWYLLFHSTFHELFSLSFDDSGTTFLYPQLQTQGGNLADAITDLAQSITAGIEFAPTGECKIARNACYLETTDRNALDTIAFFTSQDWMNFTLQHAHTETIGSVTGDGGSYNSSSGAVLALIGNAPKVAQGNADGSSALTRQVLTANLSKAGAKTELATRLGHHYAFANPADELTVDFPDSYHWLIPSRSQWYTFTIAATDILTGRAYTTSDRWLCQSVSHSHDHATGTKTVQAVFRLETIGSPGTAYEPPAVTETPITLPDIPPLPPFSGLDLPNIFLPPTGGDLPPVIPGDTGTVVPTDGSVVFLGTANRAYIARKFTTGATVYNDVTPEDIISVSDTEPSVMFPNGTGATKIADNTWQLESVEQNYAGHLYQAVYIQANPDCFLIESVTTISGAYERWDLVNDEGVPIGGPITGQYLSVMDMATYLDNNTPFTVEVVLRRIQDVTIQHGVLGFGYEAYLLANDGGSSWVWHTDDVFASAPVWTKSAALTGLYTLIRLTSTAGSLYIFANASDTETRFSSDYAATFAAAQTIEAAASTAGLDTIKVGTVVLAGGATNARKATSGGAYADYGSALPTGAAAACLLIPRYQFGSTSGNTGTTPQYLLASSALTASNEALWKVTASGATFTDITPTQTGDYGLAVGPNCLAMPWGSGSKLAVVLLFGSLPRLKVSSNAGAAWTDRGVLSADANYVRFRKGDASGQQLYIADGQPVYSPNFGASLYYKNYPEDEATAPVLFIEPYG